MNPLQVWLARSSLYDCLKAGQIWGHFESDLVLLARLRQLQSWVSNCSRRVFS